jgi:hypothetical protein
MGTYDGRSVKKGSDGSAYRTFESSQNVTPVPAP